MAKDKKLTPKAAAQAKKFKDKAKKVSAERATTKKAVKAQDEDE